MNLEMGKLYLLSGVPGAGKSTWLAAGGIPSHMVVSTDELRERLLGYRLVGDHKMHFQKVNGQVFAIAKQIVETRLSERLTTFVDATLTTDADRADFAKIAEKFGVEVEVLIFNTPIDVCKVRNTKRAAKVPEFVIDRFAAKFQRESRYPYSIVDASVPYLVPRQLESAQFDVIGDVHGLFDELRQLLKKLGYVIENGVPVHPEGRKLLFLGDVVDRGPQSIEVLQFVRRAVLAGHRMVAGNHERKLVQFWESLEKGKPEARSASSAETAMAFMKLDKKEREALIAFIRSLPGYYTFEQAGYKLAFAHATLTHFDPASTLHSECLYGSEGLRESQEKDPDAVYARNYEAGHNEYVLVRGHIPQTSEQTSVFSLEREQAFAGELVALRLDQWLSDPMWQESRDAFEEAVVTEKCDFNFDVHSKKFQLKRNLSDLVGKKLVTAASCPETGASLYKYSKAVFWDALWDESPYLAKARGLVLDLAGNILVHPFDKVFNYQENGTGLDINDDRMVQAVEKMNGFLGCISKHPWRNDLLVTTTGSFDSPFVEYIRSFITPELRGRLLKFFSRQDVTLMFEVLHPEDPHIIEYEDEDYGLWLIGARGRAENAQPVSESELDGFSAELLVKRPHWYLTTFGEIKATVETSELEGFMVRDAHTHETLLKFKTPYYLVTKFLGRMGDKKVRTMYAHPKGFKQTVDEEFYPLVDHLIANVPEETFSRMSDTDRVALVRQSLAQLRA